jgi:hypothetical protein
MNRPNKIERVNPDYIDRLESYIDYLESFIGIVRTDYFKPLEGEAARVLNHTSNRLLKESVVSTFCEKCRKPYCRCKESIIVGKAYPSLGAGIGVVISYEEMAKIFTVKYHIGKIQKVNENGQAFLVDNINPTIYDLVLNNSARILKP